MPKDRELKPGVWLFSKVMKLVFASEEPLLKHTVLPVHRFHELIMYVIVIS